MRGRRRKRRARRNLAPEDAAAGIVGYTIFNDWSARDIQRLEGELPFGFLKGKDGAHTLGPGLVTADELEPYRTADGFLDLTMRVFINGEKDIRDVLHGPLREHLQGLSERLAKRSQRLLHADRHGPFRSSRPPCSSD
jgi:2-keto-4-pentenoate hydratase/2-oxohepta-3-ene-1,7-dioic acid hydratase in catechol pathway